MDITVLFEQVFGIYLILSGVLVLIKQEEMVSIVRLFGKDAALRYCISAVITLGGLFMVLSYHNWSSIETSIITIVGWLVLIKGVVYMFSTDKQVAKMLNMVGKQTYTVWGVVALIAGLYLAAVGFGLWM